MKQQIIDTIKRPKQITLLFDLLKTRHLAAESGSKSLLSKFEDSGSSLFFRETSLEPLKHPFRFSSRLLAEKTPEGVWTARTASGFGTLHKSKALRRFGPFYVVTDDIKQQKIYLT